MKHNPDKLISKSFLTLFISIFFYLIYVSEIKYNYSRFSDFINYYVISITFILFFIVTLFLSKNLRIKCLLVFFSLSFAIYFSEFFLQISFHFEKSKITKKENFDYRSKYEFYKNLKKKNNNVIPNIWVYERSRIEKNVKSKILPLSGLPNKLTVYCNENGFWSTFNSDRHGFNNPDNIWDLDDIEFISLGDSFTLGACVYRKNNISENFKKLSKSNLLNLGYGGGPLVQLATLIEYASKKKPKKILWFFYEGNDYQDLDYEKKIPFLKSYLIDKNEYNNLILNQKKINLELNSIFNKELIGYLKKTDNDKKYNPITSFIKLQKLRSQIQINHLFKEKKQINDDDLNELKKYLKKVYEKAKSVSEKLKAEIYIVYLPEFHRYNEKNYKSIIEKKELKEIVELAGIKFIDMDQILFSKNQDPVAFFPYRQKGHYTPHGYKEVSKKLFEYFYN